MRCQVIDIDAWPVAVKLPFVVMPFMIGLSGVVMNVCVALGRDYGIVCSSITSNPYVEVLKVTWGASSFKWRFLLVCAIGGLVTFPGFALSRGHLDSDELKAFPSRLKRRLAISFWLIALGFGWMAVAALLIKLSKMK